MIKTRLQAVLIIAYINSDSLLHRFPFKIFVKLEFGVMKRGGKNEAL